MYLTTHQQMKKIIIRSPDTNVFILLLKFLTHIKQKLIFDRCTGKKRQFIDIHKV